MNRLPRQIVMLVLALSGAMHCFGARAVHVERNGLTLKLTPDNGLEMSVDGIPFSQGSSFAVVTPDWTHAFYSDRTRSGFMDSVRETKGPEGETVVTIPVVGEDHVVSGTRTVTLFPDRRARIRVDVAVTTTVRLMLEHRMAAMDSEWMAGRKWTGRSDASDASRSGTLPLVAASADIEKSTVLTHVKNLELDTRLGNVAVDVSGNAPISLVDYRKNKWAGKTSYFWFGILSGQLDTKGLHYTVTFQFPPRKDARGKGMELPAGSIMDISGLLLPEHDVQEIVPTPKSLSWGKGTLRLAGRPDVLWSDWKQMENGSARSAETLVESEMRLIFAGNDIRKSSKGNRGRIRIERKAFRGRKGFPKDDALRAEAYSLDIGDEIAIRAEATSGVLNALKTLRQLTRRDPAGQFLVRRCQVTDYPSLPFRGIHFFTGRNAHDLQVRMVRDILGAMKINELVYQCDYLDWDSLPVLRNKDYGMSKSDALAVANEAKRQGIEVVPLVNTFGHSEWLLGYPETRDLADNPANPFAYDPSNPKVYDICDRIYEETINLFHPRIMHIGHDEIDTVDFPHKQANRALGTTRLMLKDIDHYHRFLKARGIETMIWGDMLLGPGEAPDATVARTVDEARARRNALPKDIIIADWHYAPAKPSDYRSLKILNDAGFRTIACTWDTAGNIANFSREAEERRRGDPKSLGLMQTTWAGYSFDERSFRNNTSQYAAYVLAAEEAWTGGKTDPEAFDWQKVFARFWKMNDLPGSGANGWSVTLPASDAEQWTKLARHFGWNPKSVESLRALDGIYGRFRFASKKGRLGAVLMSGAFNPPDLPGHSTIKIPVGKRADTLAFALSATTQAAQGTRLGELELDYDDGTSAALSLEMGKTISAMGDTESSVDSPVLWKFPTKDDSTGFAVHGLIWENPEPARTIRALRIRSADSGSAPLVLGVAGISSKPKGK